MKTLNLVYPELSEIKYKIQKFPDGQQNVVINGLVKEEKWFDSYHISREYPHVKIKSRFNNWMDLELITCAVASLHELGVKYIHLYVPYLLGGRSDRKFEYGGNNYIRDVMAPQINSLNFETTTCVDPHSDVLEACIKGFRKESNLNLLSWSIKDIYQTDFPIDYSDKKHGNPFILVAPDAGASKKIYKLAEQIGYKEEILVCSKERDTEGKLSKFRIDKTDAFDAIINNKDFVIIDDICDGGASFINVSDAIKELADFRTYNKSSKFYIIVTHGIFSKGLKELSKHFDGIYTTNSYRDINSMTDFGRHNERYLDLVKQLNVF